MILGRNGPCNISTCCSCHTGLLPTLASVSVETGSNSVELAKDCTDILSSFRKRSRSVAHHNALPTPEIEKL